MPVLTGNWTADILNGALVIWSGMCKPASQMLTAPPSEWGDGSLWRAVTGINSALKGIGYGLLVLFFLMGFFKQVTNFKELSVQNIIGYAARFLGVKIAIDWCMDILNMILSIMLGVNDVIVAGGSVLAPGAAGLP